MGFFDSFMDENTASSSSSSTGSSSGTTAAVVEPPKKVSLKKTTESDFLIIDDTVTADSMPNTASDIFVSETKPAEASETPVAETAEISFATDTVSSETTDTVAPQVTEEISPDITFLDDEVILAEKPAVEVASVEVAPVEAVTSVVSDEVAPVETAPDTVSEEVAPLIEATEKTVVAEETVAAEQTAEVSEEMPAAFSDTFFAPSIGALASAETASADTSEVAVRQAIDKITEAIRTKESNRDAKISENERILAQIADLKKAAKLAQDEAREIDKSADHDRKLVEGLKTLIAA